MELDELHVHQRDPGAVADRHPVAGRCVPIRRLRVDAAGTAGCEDRRARTDEFDLTGAHVVRDDPGTDAVLDAQFGREIFFVDLDLKTFELFPQRVQDDEPGNIGRVAGARRTGTAERALRDPAVGKPGEDAAAVFEPNDLPRRILGHRDDRVLVAEVV